jgi:peptide/nickel transport system permease protein
MTTMTSTAAGRAWAATEDAVTPRSYLGEARARLGRNRVGMTALGILVLLTLSAIFAPLLAPYDPIIGRVQDRLLPIGSPGHILGTDELGRDMFSRLLYGGRLSLIAGITPVLVATAVGTALGAISGYLGGWVRTVLMRSMDMFYAFPSILLAIAVAASLGPGLKNVIISLSIVYIPPIARVAEAATNRVVVNEYIEAARLSGAGTLQVVFGQVLANIFNPIFVYASGLVGLSIVIAASLSFLGLGSKPPTPEWGYMLNSLRGSIYLNPWVAAVPGVFIFVTSLAFNTLSDAIRDALDVKAA